MAKFSIDLLPIEFKEEEIKRTKFYRIQVIGVFTILVIAFLSSLTIALRILQSQSLSQVQSRLTQTEQRISGLKDTQASLLLLKDRLATIDQYLGSSSTQIQMYSLVNQFLPEDITINGFSVDQSGNVLIGAVTQNSSTLDKLINDLLSQGNNQDKISQVSIETFNRGKDGVYRLSLKVQPK
ncbi:hypothetical protein HYW43_04415 [Candidatus Daviesbacteria bacterium]|nr:hypothetical protein [Candidatus Daviesbacteria bacterium]